MFLKQLRKPQQRTSLLNIHLAGETKGIQTVTQNLTMIKPNAFWVQINKTGKTMCSTVVMLKLISIK